MPVIQLDCNKKKKGTKHLTSTKIDLLMSSCGYQV